ncbi:MAG: SusC/RagA family TonB-linked outer membrane protein [Tunicatimonas sp.]
MKHTYLFTRYLLFTVTLLFVTGYAFAQSTVSGTITDADDGSAIPGVNVLVKGTSTGTITDVEGQYNVTVSGDNPTLVISSVGYATQEVEVGGQSTININMAPDIAELTEVVVTGYSVDDRRETTGSVGIVEAEDLQVVPSGNVEQQLQGRVAGVTVITNGQPGTSSIVRVRGFGALNGNEPLYIVDGVPVSGDGGTNFLAPNDIETTTILKDATTASVYGARAANGVIVYTTRNGGRNEPMKVYYDGMVGVTDPGQGPPIMNPQDQADWTWRAIRNAAIQRGVEPNYRHPQYGTGQQPIIPDYLLVGNQSGVLGSVDLAEQAALYNTDFDAGSIYQVIRANKEGTDWYNEITRPAFLQRHNIGLSGGGENSRYYISMGLQDQDGILNYQNFTRYHFRANSEFDIIPNRLRIGENIQATYRSTNILLGGGGGAGSSDDENIILTASRMPSIIPVYDEFGGYGGTIASGFNNPSNPVAELDAQRNNSVFEVQTFGNIYLEAEPIENLILRTSFGGQYASTNGEFFGRRTYEDNENNASVSYSRFSNYFASWVFTNTLSYTQDFGVHGINVLLGQEALNLGISSGLGGSGIDPFSTNPDFVTLSTLGTANPPSGGKFNGITFSSYFGRLNYDFKDRYIVSGVLRYDGSSRFGEQQRSGIFPAASAAWRISEEGFMNGVTFVDDMKIRGGYGIIGNSNNVNANNQFSLFGTSIALGNYDIGGTNTGAAEGFYRTRIGNPATTWEEAVTTNIGFDALLFDGKLDVVFDVWRRDTDGLLFPVPVTVQTGFRASAPTVNVGKMRNEGIDIGIIGKGNAGDVAIEVNVNGSFLNNEIVSLADGIVDLPGFSPNYRGVTPVLNRVGRPLSNFFGFDVVGLFPDQAAVDAAPTQSGAAPGRFQFRDINNDGEITQADRTDIGSPIPDFTGGLTIKLKYRNFELEAFTFASLGNDIYNISKLFTDFYALFPGAAISERVKDSWSFENPTGDIPIFENVSNFSTNTQSNSFYVEDGSYLRMQNITLAYKLPTEVLDRIGFEKLRIFAGVNNVFTITGYEGLDPGVGGAADTNFGIDLGNFPVTRSYTAGVNVIF